MESILPFGITEPPVTTLLPLRTPLTTDEAEVLIRSLEGYQENDCFPLRHYFAPGVYARELTMPAGATILGKRHKTRHLNIISKGRVSFRVGDGEGVRHVEAPYTFISEPGMQKLFYVHEETIWTTVHPTDETDLAKLEALLIEPHVNPLLVGEVAP